MEAVKLVRMDVEQHKTVKDAAKKQGVTFEYLFRRVIRTGINIMRLKEANEKN